MTFIFEKIKDFFYNFLDYIIAISILAAAGFFAYTSFNNMLDINKIVAKGGSAQIEVEKSEQTFEVTIPTASNLDTIASILKSYKLIDDVDLFKNTFKEKGDVERASGKTVSLKNTMTIDDIIERLCK